MNDLESIEIVMKELGTKQLQRLEKKKKKIEALMELTKLNDKDRELRLSKKVGNTADSFNNSNGNGNSTAEESPNRKRSTDNQNNINKEISEKESSITTSNDETNTKKPRLSNEEYLKLKRELRERKQKLQAIPRFSLTPIGENASLNVYTNSEDRIPIFMHDIQHLLLFSLLGSHSPFSPTRWCRLEKYSKISQTVVFVIEGLSLYHFMAYETMFPHLKNNFEYHLEVITPIVYRTSITEELAAVPLTGTQSDKLIKQYGSLENALQTTGDVIELLRTVFPMHSTNPKVEITNSDGIILPPTDKFPRTKLLLSLSQMVKENYPVPLKGQLIKKYKTYVLTKDVYEVATANSPMFGLDCEMCKTAKGEMELTRITIVDENMRIIYNSLVKPRYVITDYMTRFSGITKEMMEDVTTTLQDIQQNLRTLLPPDAILVGQSLNCDLNALNMMHPYVIDTSVIFNITGERGKKSKLRTLAQQFLGERIQDSKAGHCSAEDSRASLKLVQLKLANSIHYGDAVLLGVTDMKILTGEKKEQISQKDKNKHYATSLFNHVTKNKKTAAIISNTEIMAEYSKYLKSSSLNIMDDKNFADDDQVRLVITNNNEHTISRTCEIAMEHAFVLCHVRIKEEQLKHEHLEETFNIVNGWIQKLWHHIAMHGFACVIFGGQNKATNGVCFLSIKKEISPNSNIQLAYNV